MRAATYMAVSFGCTLGVVVGLRLSTTGLLVVATLLLSALLLCPLFALRVVGLASSERLPSVRVERPPVGYLRGSTRRALAVNHHPRRGGWPHLGGGRHGEFILQGEWQRGGQDDRAR